MRLLKDALPPSYLPFLSLEEGVYFIYQSREVPVLLNLNIQILPSQFTALVGVSRYSKLMSISLLKRFYDTNLGQILNNKQNITTFDPIDCYNAQIYNFIASLLEGYATRLGLKEISLSILLLNEVISLLDLESKKLTVIAKADIIFVLKNSKVLEKGNY
ncbi:MdlB, ABC-type multidrug transport system, ATPase and permease component [Cenococcum geophilum]